MGYDKVVDSAKLDAALGYTAGRIRLKTGDSAGIDWDLDKGFGDAVDVIQSGGTNYNIKQVTVSSNTPKVDREFDDFIFIAQADKSSMPASYSNLVAYFMMFAYVNEKFINITGAKGYSIVTSTGNGDFHGSGNKLSSTSVSATSITFSTYTDQNMLKDGATWNVLQIELASDSPVYSFADL